MRALRITLFKSIQEIQEAIDALSNPFNHQISRRLDRITYQVQTPDSRGGGHIFTLCDTIDRPLTTVGAHSKDAAMLLKRFAKHHTQIGKGQGFFLFNIVALHYLVADQKVFAGWGETRITVRRLHHTSDALRIQAIHNAFMSDERDIAEDVYLQPYGLL